MSLGKPKPHTAKEIRERREQILLLMARGYNQTDIAKELNTTRQTVMKDMKNINEMTNKGLYDLAKATLSTMYFNCVIGLNEVQKECWKIYNNGDNDPTINNWHKIAALTLTRECNESKFNIFTHAPTVMQIEVLKDRVYIFFSESPFSVSISLAFSTSLGSTICLIMINPSCYFNIIDTS